MSFFTTVFLAIVYASATLAAPWPASSKHATHRVRQLGSGRKVTTFTPPSSFETFGGGLTSSFAAANLQESALGFVKSRTGVEEAALISGVSNGPVKTTFVRQTHEGVPFANAVANVAFNGADKIVAFGSNFVKPSSFAPSTPTVPTADAISTAEKALAGKYNDHPVTVEYLAQQDNTAALTHVVQIQNEDTGSWQEAFIDAHSGELLSVTDFVADATYRVLPITKQDITQGIETLTDPQDLDASPQGWHDDGNTKTTVTAGNNVVAYKGPVTGTSTQSSEGLNFVYEQDPAAAPSAPNNVDAARTNAFYVVNKIHDIAYSYGFTEATFNFQTNNFGKGGKGGDRVRVSVQDRGGLNNANFATPPDGQSGQMNMYILFNPLLPKIQDITKPNRDGTFSNDVVVHEFGHGVTNRMTGGGTGRCLQSLEAGGLGEGWSDALGEWTEQKDATVKDYVTGAYIVNQPGGIRTRPYSTSATTNPLRYSSLASLNEVHDVGEVWANLLHNVYADLVAAKGFSATAQTDPTGTEGNVIWLHLFLDALLIQPCAPTFVTARDAWIQADVNRYNGANKCTLWKAFASRGLGQKARDFRDDATIPAECN